MKRIKEAIEGMIVTMVALLLMVPFLILFMISEKKTLRLIKKLGGML